MPEIPPASLSRSRGDHLLPRAAVVLILLPLLIASSPEVLQAGLLAFGLIALLKTKTVTGLRSAATDRRILAVLTCLLIIHLASFIGGLQHGEPVTLALLHAISGIIGVMGIGIITTVLLQPCWQRASLAVWVGLATMLVVGSLLGYLVFIDWHLELSSRTVHADPRRLALVWPTRIPLMPTGQEFWSHTNVAAFLFAAAWVVLVDFLHRRSRLAATGWALALLLGIAIFLTASRSGLVMIAAALPVLLAFRRRRFVLQTLVLLLLTFALGFAALQFKLWRIAPPPSADQVIPPRDVPGAIHVAGLVERGSAGRLGTYQLLWDELAGSRVFGTGLASNRTPVGRLLHEHSTYLATLRGGGLIALVFHLAIIGIALSAALSLARGGCRGPLVFAIAVFSGLLFDRSTVIRLTGFDEFATHWLAVWIPLLGRALPATAVSDRPEIPAAAIRQPADGRKPAADETHG